jgi:RHS repeat-associated protein
VTGSNTTTYAWDFENRLSSVTLPGTGTVSFTYDPLGRRIKKVTATATSIFAYDGDNLVEETNSSGAVVARYEPTQNIDEPLAMLRSGATSYFHADGLGSVTSLSNAAGSMANTYTYDSFGKLTASTGSLVNPFQYTGRESDTETGLYYYRARYYDPTAGRFLSEDPIGFNGGIDFYSYVRNHSTDLVDPSGLLQVCCRSAHNGPAQFWAAISLAPPPCHCFLKLANGDTLGGYHNRAWRGPYSGTMAGIDLRHNDGSDHDKYAREATCSDIPGKSCENDANAKKAFGSPRKLVGGYGFTSTDYGTSNDAAAGLLKDAGIGYTLPACAWGKGTGTIPEGPNLNAGGAPLWGFQ